MKTAMRFLIILSISVLVGFAAYALVQALAPAATAALPAGQALATGHGPAGGAQAFHGGQPGMGGSAGGSLAQTGLVLGKFALVFAMAALALAAARWIGARRAAQRSAKAGN